MNPFRTLLGRIGAALYDAAEMNRHHAQLMSGRQSKTDEDRGVKELDRTRIRQVCLNLRRNNPFAAALGQRFADNVVGSRIVPQAKTSKSDWNTEAEQWWFEWEKVADARQRHTLPEIERLIIDARLFTGDMGFILTSGGQIQSIEGERIMTPTKLANDKNVIEGVRVDPKQNIPVGFYVFARDANGRLDPASPDHAYIPRENFIFINNAFRMDQIRTLPDLTPAVDTLRHLDVLCDATLEKAKLDAMHAWFIPTPGGAPGMQGRKGYGSGSVGAAKYERFDSGQNYYGNPGEEPTSLASNTPNSQYESFVRNTLRAFGGAVGIPYEFLLLDFSQGSFASQRVGLLQTHRRFTAIQIWLTNRFLQRVWNWRIAKAIKEGQLPQAPIDSRGISEWYRVDWIYPEFGWADPHREAQGQLMEYRMATNTITMMAKAKGRDPEDLIREKGTDIATADRIAKELNAKNGTNLTWRDLIEVAQMANERPQPLPQLENK